MVTIAVGVIARYGLCPFREVHLHARSLAGQALAFSILEKVHGERAAGCGEGTALA